MAQAVSRGTIPAAASCACLAVFSAGWSTRGVEDQRRLGDDGRAAGDDEAGLVGGGGVDRLDQDGDGGLGALVAGDVGGRREPVLAAGGDLAEHGAERVVGAGTSASRSRGCSCALSSNLSRSPSVGDWVRTGMLGSPWWIRSGRRRRARGRGGRSGSSPAAAAGCGASGDDAAGLGAGGQRSSTERRSASGRMPRGMASAASTVTPSRGRLRARSQRSRRTRRAAGSRPRRASGAAGAAARCGGRCRAAIDRRRRMPRLAVSSGGGSSAARGHGDLLVRGVVIGHAVLIGAWDGAGSARFGGGSSCGRASASAWSRVPTASARPASTPRCAAIDRRPRWRGPPRAPAAGCGRRAHQLLVERHRHRPGSSARARSESGSCGLPSTLRAPAWTKLQHGPALASAPLSSRCAATTPIEPISPVRVT